MKGLQTTLSRHATLFSTFCFIPHYPFPCRCERILLYLEWKSGVDILLLLLVLLFLFLLILTSLSFFFFGHLWRFGQESEQGRGVIWTSSRGDRAKLRMCLSVCQSVCLSEPILAHAFLFFFVVEGKISDKAEVGQVNPQKAQGIGKRQEGVKHTRWTKKNVNNSIWPCNDTLLSFSFLCSWLLLVRHDPMFFSLCCFLACKKWFQGEKRDGN